jgi:hypothetical protein
MNPAMRGAGMDELDFQNNLTNIWYISYFHPVAESKFQNRKQKMLIQPFLRL